MNIIMISFLFNIYFMIRKYNEFLLEKMETKVQRKINLLKQLSLELTDIELEVEIWNGTWKDGSISGKCGSNYIFCRIKDENSVLSPDNYYETNLIDFKEIKEFITALETYGLSPRSYSGGGDSVEITFDKYGKLTDSPFI
jgi:hypothetical protein